MWKIMRGFSKLPLGDKVMLLDGNNLDIDFQCSGWQEIRQISNALEEMQARIRRLVDEMIENTKKYLPAGWE